MSSAPRWLPISGLWMSPRPSQERGSSVRSMRGVRRIRPTTGSRTNIKTTDTPRHKWTGVPGSSSGLATLDSTSSAVEVHFPQAFAEPKFCQFPCAPRYCRNRSAPVARLHPTVRWECALLRDFTLALALFLGQHVRVFTPGTSPGNPLTRFSCQGTETNVPQLNTYQLVRVVVERRLPAGSNFFIPRMNDGGFQNWRFCKPCEQMLYCLLQV